MRRDLPRNIKSNATRQRIMDVAYQALMSRQLDSMTVDGICEKAGVTKGAFYYHFDSKEQIVGNLYGISIDRFLAENGVEKPGRFTDRDALKSWMTRYILAHSKFERYWGGEVIGRFLSAQFREHMLRTVDRGWLGDFVEAAWQAQEDGFIRTDLSPQQLACAMQGWITGTANTFVFDSELYDNNIPVNVVEDFLEVFLL
ncbi:TetR/AcrR family transcriptional regulator [Oscillospiraceae bacterium OttesenSCG-928-G22]|nr:TetR/AcrR family transcriptional regulator [Oscillospiraceae bacterium OttesenSCG-928-G22]